MPIDLHNHTQFSVDGADDPEAFVRRAKRIRLAALSITEHNTLQGASLAEQAAREAGVRLIPGVELDLRWGPEDTCDHFLCYWADFRRPDFADAVARADQVYDKRYSRHVADLEDAGYHIDEDLFRKWLEKRFPLRPRPSDWRLPPFLVFCGMCSDLDDAKDLFHRVLRPTRPDALFPRISDALPAIREAGGLLLKAHPGPLAQLPQDLASLRALLESDMIDGFEVFHIRAANAIEPLLGLAAEYDCAVSGGSDSHAVTGAADGLASSPPTPKRALDTMEKAYRKRFAEPPPC